MVHAVAVLGILPGRVIRDQRGGKNLLAFVANHEAEIRESADGVVPDGSIRRGRFACLDQQQRLGISGCDECEQPAVEDEGIGALIAIEWLGQQA